MAYRLKAPSETLPVNVLLYSSSPLGFIGPYVLNLHQDCPYWYL
jgi:hypothetical protein